MKQFDCILCMRVYPGLSKKPVIYKSKIELFNEVLKSLNQSLDGVNYYLHIILDDCPLSFENLICDHFKDKNTIEIHKVSFRSGKATFRKQLEILSSYPDSQIVGFIEDDYLFSKSAIKKILSFLSTKFCFATLFNSSDYYTHPFHSYPADIVYDKVTKTYWRQCSSTTLSFFSTVSNLKRKNFILKSYLWGNYDHTLWMLITGIGGPALMRSCFKTCDLKSAKYIIKYIMTYLIYRIVSGRSVSLYCPIPGLATHLDSIGTSYEINEFI